MPQPGENRDQRSAETERDQRVDDRAVRWRIAENAGQKAEIAGDAEQRETGHQKPGHRARAESDVEAAGQRLGGGLRRAHVGAHRNVHADEARRARQNCADREAGGDGPREQQSKRDEDDDADARNRGVLPPQIGLRAFADCARDLLHALRAGVGRHDAADGVDAVDDRQQSAENDQTQQHGV